jgi:hypothetical protein
MAPSPESSSTSVVITTGAALPQTTSSTASDPEVQRLLDQLRETASSTPFTVYYLGEAHRDADMVEVLGHEDSNGAVWEVSITYRSAGQRNLLVVNLIEYDPVATPRLKKPFADWTFVRGVETEGVGDRIYRSGTGILYYVASRGSTELNLAGLTTAGYMTEEQLIETASLLVPVR